MNEKLTKKELIKNWLLLYSSEASYNYEYLQALGQANAMVPVIKKLYPSDKEKQIKELKKYFSFYNTEPSFMGPVIAGVTVNLEENRLSNESEISSKDIINLRKSLMGIVAGIGDTISQGVVYPILAVIACLMALEGSIAGPLFFEIGFKICLIVIGWNMYYSGYKKGKMFILTFFKGKKLNNIIRTFKILGLMLTGCVTAYQENIIIPVSFKINNNIFNFQKDLLDKFLPGLIPLGITFLVYFLINKKININVLIAVTMIITFILSLLNILSIS